MTSLRKRNYAQEEGRDWTRGRNTRWLPGTGDRQLAGPRGWFRVFRQARGSRERVKMQGCIQARSPCEATRTQARTTGPRARAPRAHATLRL